MFHRSPSTLELQINEARSFGEFHCGGTLMQASGPQRDIGICANNENQRTMRHTCNVAARTTSTARRRANQVLQACQGPARRSRTGFPRSFSRVAESLPYAANSLSTITATIEVSAHRLLDTSGTHHMSGDDPATLLKRSGALPRSNSLVNRVFCTVALFRLC